MTATYYGSTATSTAANPPLEVYSVIGGAIQYPGVLTTAAKGGKVFFYSSTNTPSDMAAAGVINDGAQLGMKPGDLLIGVFNGGAATTDCYPYLGVLNSTESTLSTGAYNITSNYTT